MAAYTGTPPEPRYSLDGRCVTGYYNSHKPGAGYPLHPDDCEIDHRWVELSFAPERWYPRFLLAQSRRWLKEWRREHE